MQDLKPNEQRSQNAILLIWIVLAVNCISLVSSYFQYDLLQTAANGGEISTEAVTSNDNRDSADLQSVPTNDSKQQPCSAKSPTLRMRSSVCDWHKIKNKK